MNKKVVIIGALVLLGGGAFFYFKTKAKPKTDTTGSGTAGTGTSDSVAIDTSGTGTNTSQSNTQTNQSTTVSGNGTTESPIVYNPPPTISISPASLSDLQAVVYLNKYPDLIGAFLNKYPDLIGAFHNNLQLAKEHWVTKGKAEGRTIPLITNNVSTPTQLSDDQALIYLAKYSDLLGAFGVNLQSAKEHWVTKGKAEGRTIDIVI